MKLLIKEITKLELIGGYIGNMLIIEIAEIELTTAIFDLC